LKMQVPHLRAFSFERHSHEMAPSISTNLAGFAPVRIRTGRKRATAGAALAKGSGRIHATPAYPGQTPQKRLKSACQRGSETIER
jgi:hypothetical protein